MDMARDKGHTAIVKVLQVSWFAVVGDQRGCRVSSLACAFRGELRRSGVTQVAAGQKPAEEAAPALGTMSVKQLQAECKRLGLKGYTGLNKEKLVALLHLTTTTVEASEEEEEEEEEEESEEDEEESEEESEEDEEESEVSLLELSGACDVRDKG
jgi:hypothetical protein